MNGVRITICVFAALAGLASAQESIDLRGRSIPENSIEMQIAAADLAAEAQALVAGRETPWIHKYGLVIVVPSEAMGGLGDDLESPWHNLGHTTEAGVAEDRTHDYEVWNQPIVALVRASGTPTSDLALWVVIRNSTEGISFDEYSSYEEALRGVEKDDIKRGVVVDRYTGAEVWNQGVDRLGVFVVVVAPEGAARGLGIPNRSVTNINSAHERQAYDIEASFDGAMLADEQTETTVGSDKFQTSSPGHKSIEELTLRDKGFEFVADKVATETTIGSDKFSTNSPGHKTVGELTLRTRGYSIYSTQKGLRLIVLVWDKDTTDVDLHVFLNSPDFLALLEVGPFSDSTVDPAGLSLPGSFTSFPRGPKPAAR